MRYKNRNIIVYISCLVMLLASFFVSGRTAYAASASVSVSASSTDVSVNDTVTVTVTVSADEAIGYGVAIAYDSSVLEYVSGADGGGSGTVTILSEGDGQSSSFSKSITFKAISNGSSSISSSAYAGGIFGYTSGDITTSYGSSKVTVSEPATEATTEQSPTTEDSTGSTEATTEQQTEEYNRNLASLQITPGTLEPAFSPEITEYKAQVEKDVTTITVSAVAADSTCSTYVDGADNIKPGNNLITIVVTAANGSTRRYTISVIAGEDIGEPVANIDGKKYSFIFDTDAEGVPRDFEPVDIRYKDWDVLAFASPDERLYLVCLADEDGNRGIYIIDVDNDKFTPYKEYFSDQNRYVIVDFPEDIVIPEGFKDDYLIINADRYIAYSYEGTKLYLIYAINIDGGEGLYLYDIEEHTFFRFFEEMFMAATQTAATATDIATVTDTDVADEDNGISKELLYYILIGISTFAFVLLIIVIVLAVKNGKLKAYDDTEHEDGFVDNPEAVNEDCNEDGNLATDVSEAENNEENKDAGETGQDEPVKESEETYQDEPVQEAEEDGQEDEALDKQDMGIPQIEIKSNTYIANPLANPMGDRRGHYKEYERQSDKINDIINGGYDAENDSAFSSVEGDKASHKEEKEEEE